MWNTILILCSVFFIFWVLNNLIKSFSRLRKASLTKVSLEWNVENIIQDFFKEKSDDDKRKISEKLSKPLGYSIYRDKFSCSSLVHYPNGGLGTSIHEEIELAEDVWITIHIQEGNIDFLFTDNVSSYKSFMKFPFYPIDEYLTKTVEMGEIKKLPEFLDAHIQKFGFEISNLYLDDQETCKGYGAEWLVDDWEVRSDYHSNRFRSKYADISLFYIPFSAEELSPLDKGLLLSARFPEKSENIDHSPVIKKIAALKN